MRPEVKVRHRFFRSETRPLKVFMGRTFVNATINGTGASKAYNFLVDTGPVYVGLPIEEIQALGLTPTPDGRRRFVTATGPVELDTYTALGRILN